MTRRDKFAENSGKLFGHLFKGTLNGLILSAIEVFHELFNGSLRIVQFLSALHQLLLLCCEVVVLLKGLLVNVLILFQCFVDLLQF